MAGRVVVTAGRVVVTAGRVEVTVLAGRVVEMKYVVEIVSVDRKVLVVGKTVV